MKAKPWFRAKNGLISGLSLGLAQKLDIDVFWVRLFWVLSLFFGGLGLWLYLILSVCLPREDRILASRRRWFLGVCLRLSERMEWDLGITRFACVMLAMCSLGLTILVYVLMYFFLPRENPEINGHRVIDL